MHSAVMQNKKYIAFANENTVEVIALQRLDEAVQKGEKGAAKYSAKGPNGQDVEYMVEWPNLTYDQMIALNRSKAGTYNKTGKIPYTAIVDPHTEAEIKGFNGGSSGQIEEVVLEARKALTAEHGVGLSRSAIADANETVADARAELDKGDFGKGLDILVKYEKKQKNLHEALAARVTEAREAILAAAQKRLDEVKAMEAKDAKRELSRLMLKLKGTGLEEAAREALVALNAD